MANGKGTMETLVNLVALVVDPQANVREQLAAMLRELLNPLVDARIFGQIIKAHNLETARSNLETTTIHLIIADLNLTGKLDGLELLRICYQNANWRFIPSIITSDDGEAERAKFHIAACGEWGAYYVLLKPFSAKAVVDRVLDSMLRANSEKISLMKRIVQIDPYQALAELHQLELIGHLDASFLNLRGEVFEKIGILPEAEIAYQKAINSISGGLFLTAMRNLARVQLLQGNFESAKKILEELNEISTLDLERKLSLVEIMFKLGEVEDSKNMFEQAVQLSLKLGKPIKTAPKIQQKNDLEEVPLTYYLDQIAALKEDLSKANQVAIRLRKSGRIEDASKCYEALLKQFPDSAYTHYNAGVLYAYMKAHQSAMTMFKRALELDPNFTQASNACKKLNAKISNA